jgi:hypothetical protein
MKNLLPNSNICCIVDITEQAGVGLLLAETESSTVIVKQVGRLPNACHVSSMFQHISPTISKNANLISCTENLWRPPSRQEKPIDRHLCCANMNKSNSNRLDSVHMETLYPMLLRQLIHIRKCQVSECHTCTEANIDFQIIQVVPRGSADRSGRVRVGDQVR